VARRWHLTPASAAWIALSEPGAFIMERRMLLRIKARAEQWHGRIWPSAGNRGGHDSYAMCGTNTRLGRGGDP
jgi:hypothetical protein